jgi:hypothetical protein
VEPSIDDLCYHSLIQRRYDLTLYRVLFVNGLFSETVNGIPYVPSNFMMISGERIGRRVEEIWLNTNCCFSLYQFYSSSTLCDFAS